MRPFSFNSGCFRYDLHIEITMITEDIAYVYQQTMPTPPWLCDKEHCLTRTEMVVAGP